MLSIINLDGELALDGIVHQNAGLDIHVVILVVPVSLKGDGNTIPTLSINMAQSITADLDNTLGHHVRLLIQMDVMLVGIVEVANGTNGDDLL